MPARTRLVVRELIGQPVSTANFVQEEHGVSAPTAKSTIDRLCGIGVLRGLTGLNYRRVFGATDAINARRSPVSPALDV